MGTAVVKKKAAATVVAPEVESADEKQVAKKMVKPKAKKVEGPEFMECVVPFYKEAKHKMQYREAGDVFLPRKDPKIRPVQEVWVWKEALEVKHEFLAAVDHSTQHWVVLSPDEEQIVQNLYVYGEDIKALMPGFKKGDRCKVFLVADGAECSIRIEKV